MSYDVVTAKIKPGLYSQNETFFLICKSGRFDRSKLRCRRLAAVMLISFMQGETVSLRIQCLVLVPLMVSLSSVANAGERVSVQDVTRHFRDSQILLSDACKMKSIERALHTLSKADSSLKEAKKILGSRTPQGDAEARMKSRLMYKLDLEIGFLNHLRADLGMAEQDQFESYINLRRSLIQDSEQRANVVKMDRQILFTLENQSMSL
jgi:hypothetical protein